MFENGADVLKDLETTPSTKTALSRRALIRLRVELERLVWFPDQHAQLMEIERLREIHSHTITGIHLGEPLLLPVADFGCFAFALRLTTWHGLVPLRNRKPRASTDADFLRHILVESSEVECSAATPGTVAMYETDGVMVHAGEVQANGRIRSKWGRTFVWEHAPLEVPLSYGWTLRYFNMPSLDRIVSVFSEHAERQVVERERRLAEAVRKMRSTHDEQP